MLGNELQRNAVSTLVKVGTQPPFLLIKYLISRDSTNIARNVPVGLSKLPNSYILYSKIKRS